MNVYPVTFKNADGSTFDAELIVGDSVTLANQMWTLIPANNGTEYSGTPGGSSPPAPSWTAALPNLLNLNSAYSVNIKTTYCSPTTGITLAIYVGGVLNGALPSGFTFDGTTLAYNGSGVGGPASIYFILTLTSSGQTSQSNTFSVSGVGSVGADVTAPTVPLNVAASGVLQTTATLSWLPSSDPAPSGATWSGMKQYNVAVAGAPGSPFTVNAPDTGNQATLTLADIGTQTSTIAQAGANLTFTTTAVDNPYPTNSALAFAYQQVTDSSWVASCKIASFSSAATYDNLRLEVRPTLSPTGAYAAVLCQPFSGGLGVASEGRSAAGGSVAKITSAANSTAPVWLFIEYTGTQLNFFWSLDGNTLKALGSLAVSWGSTLYVGAGANTNAGGPITAQTVQQLNIQTDPVETLFLTGLTGNTAYSATITAQDVAGNVSAASASVSFTTTSGGGGGGGSGAAPFPRFGLQIYDGGLPSAANLNQLAQYPWLMLAQTGGPISRDAAASGLKGQTLTGKNAVKPIVAQYALFNQLNASIHPEWSTVVNNNNWPLYKSGKAGTQVTADVGVVVDVCPIALVGTDGATGLYPYQWAAQFFHDKFITGGGLATQSASPSANIDCAYIDNVGPYLYAAGDWLRNGDANNADQVAQYSAGIAQLANKWAAIDSSRPIIGNVAWGYAQTQGGNFANINGLFSYPMSQFFFGRGELLGSVVMNWGGFAQTMTYYKGLLASSKNGSCTITGGFTIGSDYQLMRQALCFTLLDNGYLIAGDQSSNVGDGVNGTDNTSFPQCDEFWGGSLQLGGYLGAPITGALGAVTGTGAAWQNGVYRRDFANGIVLVNSTGSSQTVNLGGTYYHLRSTTGQAINSGASATSVTLGTFTYPGKGTVVGECCVLLNSAPP